MNKTAKLLMFLLVFPGSFLVRAARATDSTYVLTVLPREDRTERDSVTFVDYTYLTTTNPSTGLYFHQRAWLPDNSMVVFESEHGLTGYLMHTGELVVIGRVKGATVAARRNSIFGMRGNNVIEIALAITASANPGENPSQVVATERIIATLPGRSQINGNYNDTFLSAYVAPTIYQISVATGQVREVCRIGPPVKWRGHLQWSRTASNLLSFAGGDDRHVEGGPDRIWVVDPNEGIPRPVYAQIPGELVTHESWWVNDQILFCGAPRAFGFETDSLSGEYSHVKVLDPRTGTVRIIGAGSWMPGVSARDLWTRNWGHCAGSDDGNWVVADNFHGVIALFGGKSSRARLLTVGHRVYGGGAHAHPSFDREGKIVVFTSNRLGEPRVCIARIPWRAGSF
ncbi:MAG TPA: hypothetical protein PLJ50_06955 [Candidatus Latescibacteria bacterium]|nr:hypothetical protein [Candidatus Latescibacterota bacterium]